MLQSNYSHFLDISPTKNHPDLKIFANDSTCAVIAHKIILASHSYMLKTAFISSGVVGEAVLILPDFSVEDVNTMIQLLYGQISEVNTPSDLFSVLGLILRNQESENGMNSDFGAGLSSILCYQETDLANMGEEACIDDDLFNKIYDGMMERLKDKVAEVRSQAVIALQRLQDPKDEECPIIRAYLFHLAHDPNNVVRITIVRCIVATRLTLPHILERTRDTDEHVRRVAYKFLAEKVHIKSLTIEQREGVLGRGLGDRSKAVRFKAHHMDKVCSVTVKSA